MRRSNGLVVIGVLLFGLQTQARADHVIGPEEADRARIRQHLARVERQLRARDVSDLTPAQRRARERNLDALREYRQAGVFPRNTEKRSGRVPVFIDKAGRECAMGHLLMQSGARKAARTIAREQNYARVVEIDSVDLEPWLTENGMTVQEAQRVQPNYCFCDDNRDLVCGEDGNTYLNRCVVMECSGTTVQHEGSCQGDAGAGADAGPTEPIDECACPGGEGSGGCGPCATNGHGAEPGMGLGGLALIAVGLAVWRRRLRRS